MPSVCGKIDLVAEFINKTNGHITFISTPGKISIRGLPPRGTSFVSLHKLKDFFTHHRESVITVYLNGKTTNISLIGRHLLQEYVRVVFVFENTEAGQRYLVVKGLVEQNGDLLARLRFMVGRRSKIYNKRESTRGLGVIGSKAMVENSNPPVVEEREYSIQPNRRRLTNYATSIEKLNSNNYASWSIRIRFYLVGQDLWDIVNGSEITPPKKVRSTITISNTSTSTPTATNAQKATVDPDALRKWNVKAGEALYVLTVAVEDEFLHWINDVQTPKEAWDTLREIFAKKNAAKLQKLENDLLSISQKNLPMNQYFSEMKLICDEIFKLDPENKILKRRKKKVIHE